MANRKTNDELVGMMDSAFKYKIGDLVYHRCGMKVVKQVLAYKASREKEAAEFEAKGQRLPSYFHEKLIEPAAYLIVERFLQECHGGVQMQYRVAASNGNGVTSAADSRGLVTEIELFSLDELNVGVNS